MTGRIGDQRDRASAVRQIEGKSRRNFSAQLLRLVATCDEIVDLHIDNAVKSADLAICYANRPNRHSSTDNLRGQIAALHCVERPTEQLSIELLRLLDIRRRDVEPSDAAGADIHRN